MQLTHMNRLEKATSKFTEDGYLLRKKRKEIAICDFLGFPLKNMVFQSEKDIETFVIYTTERNINLFQLSKYPLFLKLHCHLAGIEGGVKNAF